MSDTPADSTTDRLPMSVFLLSLCNAYLFIGASLLITVSALIGFELADDKRLATLPMALQFFAIMSTSVPASLLMARIGRKGGFLFAGCVGLIGACIALWAIFNHSFVAFCIATVCFGVFNGFGNYYRFTAAEIVPSSIKSLAISMVMAGGVIAAFIGPNLANWSSGVFAAEIYAGPFAALLLVYVLAMLTISLARLPPPPPRQTAYTGRPLAIILTQPIFVVAVMCQMLGYGTMNLVMSSTPLAMHTHDFGMSHTALVIQWHVVAMFAPSFLTGHLIRALGIVPVLLLGVVAGLVCIGINLHGTSLGHFVSALVLLGISWNFLFVGGTTLMTDAYRPEEKARTQAANDLIVFTTVTLTALSAGGLHHVFGWHVVNLTGLPMLLAAALSIAWLWQVRRSSGQVTQPSTR